MRKILVIGIGTGDPDHVTMQAVKALNKVDVFFVMDKGPGARELVEVRREICSRYVERPGYRFVEAPDPPRDREVSSVGYAAAVDEWTGRRAALWESLIAGELGEDGCGAFLVWGDPSLYDSTLRVVEEISARGRVAFDYEVIPGISSVQVLAARHRVSLSRVGRPVEITTGRRLGAGGVGTGTGAGSEPADVVVMLDGELAFRRVDPEGVTIYWGAYLGMEDETLLAGDLGEVSGQIEAVRGELRARKGWIMDTYLLRRREE